MSKMARTVVVLDNGIPGKIRGAELKLKYPNGSRNDGAVTKVIHRSAWTSIIEGGCEFARIVGDLYPADCTTG